MFNNEKRVSPNKLPLNRVSQREMSKFKISMPVSMSSDWDNEEQWNDNNGHGLVVESAKPKTKQPPLYKVLLLNDDYTPMEFVVFILESFFTMDRQKATQIMLTVHTEGKAVCGVFPRDIAETKATQIEQCAVENEHPLKCEVEVG